MKKYQLGLVVFLTCYSLSVFAVDVTININGSILSQSCNVKSNDLTKSVQFDDLNPKNFPTVGSTSVTQPVTIGLENCVGALNGVTYKFSGDADDYDSTLLKVKGSNGNVASTGLAVEILDSSNKAIPLNQLQSFTSAISTTTYDFRFYLRYKSVSQAITPGDASAVLYWDIYYE